MVRHKPYGFGWIAYDAARYGFFGVELFFLISGFVIGMSGMGRSLGEFFVARVVRLYPAYWFAVIATTLVDVAYPHVRAAKSFRDVTTNLIMVLIAYGKLGVTWPWLTTAGVLTYPLYLLHQDIGWAMISKLQHRVPHIPLVLGVLIAMLGLAWLVHRYVERPVARLMRRSLVPTIERYTLSRRRAPHKVAPRHRPRIDAPNHVTSEN